MNLSNEILWLIAGAVMVILEFTLVSGVGFLFAGIGALIVGALVTSGILPETTWQWVVFFALSVVSAIALWKPLMQFKSDQSHRKVSDIAGQKALLVSDIAPGQVGKAKWSGTTMNARLEASLSEIYAAGTEVEIVNVEGNILIVK